MLALALALAPFTAAAQDAAALYRARCAVCHGAEGRGDGPAAPLLAPKPRDFTSGVYKFRSTPSGSLPTEADVFRTITRGLSGTSMPPFADLLNDTERRALARHVLAFAPPSRPTAGSLNVPFFNWRPALAARGEQAYVRAGCAKCHGEDGRGEGWRPKQEGPTGEVAPTNLTEPWSFRGGAQIDDIALRILGGIDGSPMPSFADSVSRNDALVIAAYVLTLGREPIWRVTDPARIATAGVASDPLARGRYLVNAMACTLCHTPVNAESGAYDPQFFLAGGMRVSAYPWGVWYSRNLTPDVDTGLGRWSEAEIVTAITRGIARDGRQLHPMAMPWVWFSRLTPSDAQAIATYLKALPPIRNDVPKPRLMTVGEEVGGKLLALLGAESAIGFWGGNAAVDRALVGIPVARAWRVLANVIGWGSGAGAPSMRCAMRSGAMSRNGGHSASPSHPTKSRAPLASAARRAAPRRIRTNAAAVTTKRSTSVVHPRAVASMRHPVAAGTPTSVRSTAALPGQNSIALAAPSSASSLPPARSGTVTERGRGTSLRTGGSDFK